MKTLRMIFLLTAFMGLFAFYACGGPSREEPRQEEEEVEEMEKSNEEKTQQMIDKAEEMESDSTSD